MNRLNHLNNKEDINEIEKSKNHNN